MTGKEAYLIELSDKLFSRYWHDGFEGLSRPEQVFVCIWELEKEVNNGGFDQFFFNLAGDIANETLGALEAIGAPYTADLVRRACGVFPGGNPPKDRNTRQDLLLAMGEGEDKALRELDRLFYEYKEHLSELLYAFVEKHRDQIRGA